MIKVPQRPISCNKVCYKKDIRAGGSQIFLLLPGGGFPATRLPTSSYEPYLSQSEGRSEPRDKKRGWQEQG